MIYTKTFDFPIEMEITPEDAAAAFEEWDAQQQAWFFNKLAELVVKWDGSFAMQMQYVADDPDLTDAGRAIMRKIGEYGQTNN